MALYHFTEEGFDKALASGNLMMVDFWATWCGPCRMLAPTIAELAEELNGKVKVGKVDVDEQPGLAAKFGVSSIPTLIVFDGGKAKSTTVGVRPKGMILDLLK